MNGRERPAVKELSCPAGAEELLKLVPRLMLKLQEEEEEEVLVLLLSTLTSCSRLDPGPALASDGVSLLRHKLMHSSTSVRREAAAAMMVLWSVTVPGCWWLFTDGMPLLCLRLSPSVPSLSTSVCVWTGSSRYVRGRCFLS